jgi:hypothetical protein
MQQMHAACILCMMQALRIRLCKRITRISCQSLVVPACRARIAEGASDALFGGPRIPNYLGIRLRYVGEAVSIRPTKRIARMWCQRSVAPACGARISEGGIGCPFWWAQRSKVERRLTFRTRCACLFDRMALREKCVGGLHSQTLTSEAALGPRKQACYAFQAHCHEAHQAEGNRSQNIELGLTAACSLPCIKNRFATAPSSWRGQFFRFCVFVIPSCTMHQRPIAAGTKRGLKHAHTMRRVVG